MPNEVNLKLYFIFSLTLKHTSIYDTQATITVMSYTELSNLMRQIYNLMTISLIPAKTTTTGPILREYISLISLNLSDSGKLGK